MTVPTAEDLLSLFPPGATLGEDGTLTLAGASLLDIADDVGTPAYVVDGSGLRERVRRFRDALETRRPGGRIVFASKSFPCSAVYRLMADEGVAVDVAGGGELVAALRAGVPARDLVLHGNAKTDAELRMAIDADIGLIVIDNDDDLRRLEMVGGGRRSVLVRVTPGVRPDTYEAVSTGQEGSKFGIPLERVPDVIARVRASRHLHLAGLHVHIGSQILDLDPFVETVRIVATLGEFEVYDLGGGLGARYTYTDRPPEPEQWIDALTTAARDALPSGAQLLLEPGRSVVANCGLTLYRVVTVKAGERPIVAVDGGMGDNLEVALYGQRFEATLVERVGGGELVDLVGRHCESGDRLSVAVALRDPRPGDLVAVPATGAYCFTMANNYNGALRPPVVFVADGRWRTVVRRENYDDLLARDML